MESDVAQGPAKRRPGIVDVAALAGVAPSTVSRSLSNQGKVSAQTRERVMDAARKLSYVPSPYAAGLATGRTNTVAVVVPFMTRWFFGSVMSGVTEALERAGYDVLLYHLGTAADRDRFFDRMPLARRVDGILSVSMPLTDEHTLALRALDIPIVTVGSHMSGLPSVRIDEVAAAEQAVNHLLHLGHQQIAFLGGIADDPDFGFISSEDRLQGYRRALTAAGAPSNPSLEAFGRYGVDGGAAAMTRLMSMAQRPTAVFAEYDELAIGALWSLRRAGLHVPQDISVVGIDDHDMAKVLDLTTVGQDAAGQGVFGANLLIGSLDTGRDAAIQEPPADIVLQTDLIIRGSSAPPNATRLGVSRALATRSAKQELVLDRIEEFRERYGRVVRDRPAGTTPASALRPLVDEDVERYRTDDPKRARGQFPAQSVASSALRRFTLEAREQQVETVSTAIVDSSPEVHPVVARAHAAALISVIQTITDQIGAAILDGAPVDTAAKDMLRIAHLAFDDLDRTFRTVTSSPIDTSSSA